MRRRECCPSDQSLAEYSDGQMRSRKGREIEGHLQQCRRCRQAVARLRCLHGVLESVPTPEPPADLPTRVEAAVENSRSLPALTCRQAHLLISADLDEETAPTEHEVLWGHLFNCSRCLRRYRETKRIVTVARRPITVPVPRDLPARILAAVEQVTARPPARRAARVRLGLAAIAAVVVTLLAWGVRAPTPETPEVAQFAEAVWPVEPSPLPEVIVLPEAVAEGEVAARSRRAGSSRSPAPPAAATGERVERAQPSGAVISETTTPPVSPVPQPATVHIPEPPRPAASSREGADAERLPAAESVPAVREPEAQPRVRPPEPEPPTGEPALAALPPRPLRTPVVEPPVEVSTTPPSREPLVVHSPPQSPRELRWTPVQPSSVVVYEGESSESDASLAQAAETLNQYAQRLERAELGEPKKFEIWR